MVPIFWDTLYVNKPPNYVFPIDTVKKYRGIYRYHILILHAMHLYSGYSTRLLSYMRRTAYVYSTSSH